MMLLLRLPYGLVLSDFVLLALVAFIFIAAVSVLLYIAWRNSKKGSKE